MEDVLEVYQRPYDPRYPVVCLDEKGKELQADKPGREPLPAQPGHYKTASCVRQDYEYERKGSANILLVCEPLRGWRKTLVNQERDRRPYARLIKQLVDQDFPDAVKIVLVEDNLNIHGPWSLYDVFPPEEAQRIANKIEWHYTPEHGSWLNMAELELSAMTRQCLGRRFDCVEFLRYECEAWCQERNQRQVTIKWQFTAADARIRLHRLYPVIEDII
jgi:hypothetical protein